MKIRENLLEQPFKTVNFSNIGFNSTMKNIILTW